jgi:hypothetical protein
MASNRGPNSQTSQEYYKARDTGYDWAKNSSNANASSASGGVGGSWASTPSVTITSAAPSTNVGPAVSSTPTASDGTYERNLIAELCPPGGMKPVPPPDKLDNFKRVVHSLNSDWICPVLLDALEEGQPWIIRAKALCVMEVCIESGTKLDGSNPYRDFFHACAEEIQPLTGHARSAIKDPARRVLRLLGVDGSSSSPSAAPPAAAAPVVAAPNLLDFDDEPAAPPVQAPPQAPTPPSASLFGGMQLKQAGTPSPAVPPAAAAPPAPVVAAAPPSLLDFGSPPTGTSAPPSNDVFREPTTTSSMFDQMTLKESGEDKKSESDDAGDHPAPGASGFGFMNQSPSVEAINGHAMPAAAPAITKQSFDPLLTPNTTQQQKKTMAMSPEQMRAMAYQQMMYQQQMQHMQMAMAMQKNGGGMPHGMPGMPHFSPMQGVGSPPPNLSFKDTRPAKKDDKKFDFVKDAMQTANAKKN